VDEHLVTELIELERRIAADEFTITLARSAGGADANKVTLVEDLQRRIAETASRLDALRVQLAEATVPATPARPRTVGPEHSRTVCKRPRRTDRLTAGSIRERVFVSKPVA
jgi:hypothetical protein